ncbi:MAG: phospholipase D family protein, partial [Alphaproteobacteria bacterium]
EELLASPLAMLEGLERSAERIVIFCEAGRIAAEARGQSRLAILLERIVVEAAAPGGGAFHPKLWAIRFAPLDPGERPRMRLLVLSRNLTRDRSWDLALSLDGVITGRLRRGNRPIADLVRALPDMATAPPAAHVPDLAASIAADLDRVEWEPPEPFDGLAFAVHGVTAARWSPEACRKLAVISPFVDTTALRALAAISETLPVLVSRTEALAELPADAHSMLERSWVMDDAAESEDGDDAASDTVVGETLTGLHAKAYLQDMYGGRTLVTIGSANATTAGLLPAGHNVEVLVSLTGQRGRVGSVDDLLGVEHFGRLLRPYEPVEASVVDAAAVAAERTLEEARRMIARAGFRILCAPDATEPGAARWRVRLKAQEPLDLACVGSVEVWPITLGDGHARHALEALRMGAVIDLGVQSIADISRFVTFRLTDEEDLATALFSVGASIEGLSGNRIAAVWRAVIDSREAFLRYLRLLLANLDDPLAAQFALAAAKGATWRGGGAFDEAVLEDMVRALDGGGERLDTIQRLMRRLALAESGDDVVPADFKAIWRSFQEVLDVREGVDAE